MVGIVIGIKGTGHLTSANLIDDLDISFFFFFKRRFLPVEEILLYFSIHMKNVRLNDCTPCNGFLTLLLVFDWKIRVFAIYVQGDKEKVNGGFSSRESTRDYTLFHFCPNVILMVR